MRVTNDIVNKKTGLVIDPTYSGSKIRWILDEVEGAQEEQKRVNYYSEQLTAGCFITLQKVKYMQQIILTQLVLWL